MSSIIDLAVPAPSDEEDFADIPTREFTLFGRGLTDPATTSPHLVATVDPGWDKTSGDEWPDLGF